MASPPAPGPDPAPILHRAARLEDSVHRWRERRARRNGRVVSIVPYAGYGGDGWIRVLCRVLYTRDRDAGLSPQEKVRGWRSFTSVPVAGAAVAVTIAGQTLTVTADRGGVVDEVVPVPAGALASGWNTVQLGAEGHSVEAPVYVLDPDARFGVISDIDDTVMVTALPRPLLAGWNTFVVHEHARRAVAGMAVLYDRLLQAQPGSPLVYLSTGAWNVAPTLDRFLSRNLYPRGPLLLTDWGPTTDRFFRSGRQHKRDNLARLAREFPRVRWLLVGDDGQHDESLYGEFERRFPDSVAAVAIRQLSLGEAVWAGGRQTPGQHDDAAPWLYAPDGAGLAALLAEHGFLAAPDVGSAGGDVSPRPS